MRCRQHHVTADQDTGRPDGNVGVVLAQGNHTGVFGRHRCGTDESRVGEPLDETRQERIVGVRLSAGDGHRGWSVRLERLDDPLRVVLAVSHGGLGRGTNLFAKR